MIHGVNIASWLDPDGVSGLDLHCRDIIGSWTDLIGADGAN